MFAAAGYAHATGKLGVVAVTSGPGALNSMTGLASAWCDGLPVLLLVGEVPRASMGKGVLQDGSQPRPPDRRDGSSRHEAGARSAQRERAASSLEARDRDGVVGPQRPGDADAADRCDDGTDRAPPSRRLDHARPARRDRDGRRNHGARARSGASALARRQRMSRQRSACKAARGRRAARLPGRHHAESEGRVPRRSSVVARRARPRWASLGAPLSRQRRRCRRRDREQPRRHGDRWLCAPTPGVARARPCRHRRSSDRQELLADPRGDRIGVRDAWRPRRSPRQQAATTDSASTAHRHRTSAARVLDET